eukprot:CAMPEP_0172322470 /NCGR_PEP_ID=MMETSP1058-20130122/45954_1 /TAXON_ID=83371 /ORGANISM="Detonula confervacea, Strain CCMP 353" /LENGTH=724 /DNA_ID=CAMNT_0013038217 /DNA_START=12 /DNA_END=2183 /DNA_ORIENTATION=-
MANTSRKRPAPAPTPTTSSNVSNGTLHSAPPSQQQRQQPLPSPVISGIDTLLAKYARHLPPGGSISIRLIKGPTSQSVDPIAARQAAKKAAARNTAAVASSGVSSGNDSDDNNGAAGAAGPKATNSRSITAPLTFPRMAKFSETVTQPDFGKSLRDGRIYEEEVPKAKDESDEEESTAYKPSNIGEGDPNNPTAMNDAAPKKKKRRWRRNDPRPRRWVLQEKAEFFDRIRKRRQRGSTGGDDGEDDVQAISNQYHGVLESNNSKYVLLSVAPTAIKSEGAMVSSPSSKIATEQICIQPIHGFHTFSQPYKFASLTMEEAENALEQQRNVVTRYMMHGKMASQNNSSEAKAALASGVASVGGGGGRGMSRSLGPTPKAMSRARLLGKLAGGGGAGGDAGDDDDVMGDVRFSSKGGGGGGSKARKELLSSLGGDGVTVDDDGVLGGANNSEFGGRQRFGRVAVNKDAADGDDAKKGGKGGATSTGFEAGAMEEGFYQRDVAAEYEALDYDANEQFDDDDVNVGEDEMMDDGGGFGGGDYESEDDNMLDSDDEEGSDDDAFGGMATASGLKAMLARARGESPVLLNGAENNATLGTGMDALDASTMNIPENGSGANGAAGSSGGKTIGKFLDAAKKTTEEKKNEKKSSSPGAKSSSASMMAEKGIEKDKDGKRLITLEAVRREIWLNNGAITSKRLTKKFDVGKKHPDRQALFKSIVMELCTIKKDA